MAFVSVVIFMTMAAPVAETNIEVLKIAAFFMAAVNFFYYFYHYKVESEYYKEQAEKSDEPTEVVEHV
jgi:Ca2+/Na+ antiporter